MRIKAEAGVLMMAGEAAEGCHVEPVPENFAIVLIKLVEQGRAMAADARAVQEAAGKLIVNGKA